MLAWTTVLSIGTAHAQHTDHRLGSGGLFVAEQPPPGIYHQKQPLYYWPGTDKSLKPLIVSSDLDLFVDLNTIGWTTFLEERFGRRNRFSGSTKPNRFGGHGNFPARRRKEVVGSQAEQQGRSVIAGTKRG